MVIRLFFNWNFFWFFIYGLSFLLIYLILFLTLFILICRTQSNLKRLGSFKNWKISLSLLSTFNIYFLFQIISISGSPSSYWSLGLASLDLTIVFFSSSSHLIFSTNCVSVLCAYHLEIILLSFFELIILGLSLFSFGLESIILKGSWFSFLIISFLLVTFFAFLLVSDTETVRSVCSCWVALISILCSCVFQIEFTSEGWFNCSWLWFKFFFFFIFSGASGCWSKIYESFTSFSSG